MISKIFHIAKENNCIKSRISKSAKSYTFYIAMYNSCTHGRYLKSIITNVGYTCGDVDAGNFAFPKGIICYLRGILIECNTGFIALEAVGNMPYVCQSIRQVFSPLASVW